MMRYSVVFGLLTCSVVVRAEGGGSSDFATDVISYTEGTGVPLDFLEPGQKCNDPNRALGRPTVDTTPEGWYIPLGNPVPVVPVYQAFRYFEVVTVGNGGQLTLRFDHPVLDDSRNPFGADFIIFGNAQQRAYKEWTNGNPAGLACLGSVLAEPGIVSVSQDGSTWYTFGSGLRSDTFAPTLGRVYESDPNRADPNLGTWNLWWGGSTMPTWPLDPNLTAAGFAGKTVAQVVTSYGRSAGGTAFDIGALGLGWIQYVRIEDDPNASATSEIDAVSDVAPGVVLTITEEHDPWGTVEISPNAVAGPPPVYFPGTQVTLTAAPIEGKAFDHWEFVDPNRPDDANYFTIDANSTTTVAMDFDRQVIAVFKCGNGTGLVLPLLMLLAGVSGTMVRRWR